MHIDVHKWYRRFLYVSTIVRNRVYVGYLYFAYSTKNSTRTFPYDGRAGIITMKTKIETLTECSTLCILRTSYVYWELYDTNKRVTLLRVQELYMTIILA